MVANYSDATKLKHARQIAKDGGCFVVERTEKIKGKTGGLVDRIYWLLYRVAEPRNVYIGKRTSIGGLLALVKLSTGYK